MSHDDAEPDEVPAGPGEPSGLEMPGQRPGGLIIGVPQQPAHRQPAETAAVVQAGRVRHSVPRMLHAPRHRSTAKHTWTLRRPREPAVCRPRILVTTTVLRWLLPPRTSWEARKLVRSSYGNLTFDAAWRAARVRLCPDEAPYQRHGHTRPANRTL